MNDISIDLVKEAYLPGEIIKGTVRLELEKSVKARAVKLRIIGLEETRVEVGSGDDSHTYHERNYILKNDIILHSPMYDKDLELDPGNYAFVFEFKMPENALPSYKGTNVSVTYTLEARVDVPWWLDIVEKRPIYVFRNREVLNWQEPVLWQGKQSKEPWFCIIWLPRKSEKYISGFLVRSWHQQKDIGKPECRANRKSRFLYMI
jgi:hypothetical protein